MSEVIAEQENSPQAVLAYVRGEAFTDLPLDLYIPPDALEVFLETFEGPLDLLLYLIKKQNIDVLDIPIAEITRQYMDYVDLMKEMHLDLAAEYLVMAAMLAEIKSRMLLPRHTTDDGEEEDPRAELVRRLQEYERYKKAAEELDSLPRLERDNFPAMAEPPDMDIEKAHPDVDLKEMLLAFRDVLQRAQLRANHHVQRESLSIRERMTIVLGILENNSNFVPFHQFFTYEEGRMGVVVTFVAILELLKGAMIELVQAEAFGLIHIRAISI